MNGVPAGLVPAAQDAVEIPPVQILLIKHRALIGQRHRLRREAHVHPLGDVAPLRVHHLALGQVQRAHVGGGLLLPLRPFFQVRGGGGLVEDAQLRPVIALLLDLPQGGTPSLSPLAARPLHAVAHQQIDHVRGHADLVVQPRQNLQVGGAQLLAQLLLRLGDQQAEALVVRQQTGDVLRRVHRTLLRRGGRRVLRRAGQNAQLLQHPLRRVDAQAADGQRPLQLLRGHAPSEPAQRQIQERRIALSALQQLVRGGGAQRQLLLAIAQDIALHGAPSLLIVTPILHENRRNVKRGGTTFYKFPLFGKIPFPPPDFML